MKLIQANLRSINSITPPPGKSELRVFDDDLTGFGIRVRDGGKRAWIIQYRINGKQTTKTIGSVAKLSPARARQVASRDLAEAELGTDPQAKKAAARQHAAETFETTAARFMEHKRSRLKPRSFEQVETHLTKHWASFNRLPVHSITRRDIAEQLGKIASERGPYAANRARATLANFFTWTMKEGLVDANPVIATNRQTDETARDRVLTDAEIVAIWKGCNGDDYGNIVQLLILTAQRRDEVGAMVKSEIAIDERKWTIPSARTKNGKAHEVPLSDAAVAILGEVTARAGREDIDAIFGEGAAGRGFSGWSRAKAALDKRINTPAPWRLHDIRRTVATRMADLGVLPHVIEAVLNHISGHKAGVAGVYNRAVYAAEKRQALDLWAAHVEALIAGKTASNIVQMKA